MFDIAAGWMARLGSAIIPDTSKEAGWIVDSQVDEAFVGVVTLTAGGRQEEHLVG